MQLKNLRNTFADFVLVLLLSFSFTYALISSLNLEFPVSGLLCLLAGFGIIYPFLFFSKITRWVTLSLVGLTLAISILYFFLAKMWLEVFAFFDDYSYWLSEYIQDPDLKGSLYIFITAALVCFITSLFVYIFTVRRFSFIILLITGASIFCVQWMYNFTSTITPFYLFMVAILLYYFRHILNRKSKSSKNQYVDYATFLICMLPVCIVVVFTASLFNASSKPLEWKWLDKKIANISSYFDQKFDYKTFDYFSFGSSGFSQNDNTLGGRVRLNNTPVLRVKTGRRVYLRGSIKDTYTGTRWERSKANKPAPLVFNNKALEQQEKYYSNENITVQFLRLKTKSLFVPIGFTGIYADADQKRPIKGLLMDEYENLSLTARQEKGFTYTVNANVFNYSDKDLAEKLKNPSLFSGRFGNRTVHTIPQNYYQLPGNLPQRVKDLALSLTSQYPDNYEKAKAIESFLSSNYPYTLETRRLPRNRDFVDYFLFDQKQGYCTYYASAMAVLARCAGIPARYVEGYMLPPNPGKDGFYTVTNMNAHAWVEIYLEGFGWTPFEPTSSFQAVFYSNTKDESLEGSGAYSGGNPQDEYLRMMERYRDRDSADVNIQDLNVKDRTNNSMIRFYVFGGILLILLLSFLVINLVNLIRHRSRIAGISKLSERESIILAYSYYLELLRLQKLGIRPGETPLSYSKRIDSYFTFFKTTFSEVSKTFTKARYSNLEITPNEKSRVYEFHRELLKETRSNVGKFKFYFMKNILGQF